MDCVILKRSTFLPGNVPPDPATITIKRTSECYSIASSVLGVHLCALLKTQGASAPVLRIIVFSTSFLCPWTRCQAMQTIFTEPVNILAPARQPVPLARLAHQLRSIHDAAEQPNLGGVVTGSSSIQPLAELQPQAAQQITIGRGTMTIESISMVSFLSHPHRYNFSSCVCFSFLLYWIRGIQALPLLLIFQRKGLASHTILLKRHNGLFAVTSNGCHNDRNEQSMYKL